MWTCAGVLLLAASVCAITRDRFYPYGSGLDQRLPRGQEVPSPELHLKIPILFYGETYDSVFVNNYGLISFRAGVPSFLNAEFPLPYPSIAAFYTNIDTTESGDVYYRETAESHVLTKAEESVQNNFHDYYDFKPTSVFIVTWVDVTYSADRTHKPKNSFQIAVISNGTESFVELLYPDREIQWIQRESEELSLPDAKAQVGFVAEDGRVFTLRGSGSDQIRNVIAWSNTQEPGKYVFRIGSVPPDGNVAVPDQYNQTDEFEEESKTCAQTGPSMCHMQARCVDYQQGICCQCNDGFYGNGRSCIKDDVPLRIHGKVNGVINDVMFNDVDIQAYVVTAEGRSYTALSLIPQNLGSSLQLITVLDTTIGWLFARPSLGAKNGYQITGSVFNHTADIYFPGTSDRVSVNQEYLGHDVFGQIAIETEVRGSVPFLADGTKLDTSEFIEQYTMVEPGLIRSQATRKFTNRETGREYEQRISQTFSYHPCRFAPVTTEDTTPSTLRITKNYLGYESNENIVRYGTSNKITPLGHEDPCVQGRKSCGPHSSCVVQGESFTCQCSLGYTNIMYDNSVVCIDVDECAAGVHNCDANADCLNYDGGFECKCRTGFEGNGITCNVVSLCQSINCDSNAQCVMNLSGEPICVCKLGFTGDGQTCWPIQIETNPCNNACSPDASCIFSDTSGGYMCKCHAGYSGDGYYCTEEPPTTTPPPDQIDEVYNETFVLPNCNTFSCICPPGYSSYKDESENDLCRINYFPENPVTESHDNGLRCTESLDCPPNAICSFSPTDPHSASDNIGHCACLEGYEGDGYECIERTGYNCNCGGNGHCIETQNNEFLCICNTGYHGDGYECHPNFSCNNDSDCEYNAECRRDVASNEYICQCIEGFVKDQNDACIPGQLCNGAQCAKFASCLYDEVIDVHYCYCDPGYDGDGLSRCSPIDRGTDQTQEHATGLPTCNVINDCSIDAICTPIENTYQCVCREGYVGDGYNCIQEENCKTHPSLCDSHASCLKRSDSYDCVCNSGYTGNGSYCEINARQAGNFLVVSEGATVYRVPFQTGPRQYTTPINSAIYQIAVGIHVDCQKGRIYWGDVVSNSIKSAAYDGSAIDNFLAEGIKSPEGLSVDWGARNIFWTDSKKLTIEVANMDTKVRKVLFSGGTIVNPRGIAVHPRRGKVFWSDWNRLGAKIEWANMDGSERGVFLDQADVKLPNSLAIDWDRDRICYADAGLFVIKCVNIDTMERETIASNCSYPFGLAINGNKFYWTDWKSLRIEYIDISTQVKGTAPISTGTRLYGLTVAPDQCPISLNVCQYWNGDCRADELCLPTGNRGRTCVQGDKSFLGESNSIERQRYLW